MRISIVTISFNQAGFLRAAIDSVFGQGYPDLEYVVVDPGSVDGSRDLARGYGSQISKLVFEPDAGPADGLNKGFACTTGGILGFVNADDELLPGSLQFVADFFQRNPGVDVLLGCGRIVDEKGNITRHIVPSRFSLRRFALGHVEFIQQAMFFRRSIFDAAGRFNVSNKISWDGELLLDMARAGGKFARSERELGIFRIYPASISGGNNYSGKLLTERERLFHGIMGRDTRWYDLWIGRMLWAAKWLLDPWYARYKLGRNLGLLSVARVVNYLKALMRPGKLAIMLCYAKAKASNPALRRAESARKMAFVVGCGRSETTILGKLLSLHPRVRYFFEPWHLWRAADDRTDVLHLFGNANSHLFMGKNLYSREATVRFNRLFFPALFCAKKISIEKTPHNALRIGYLEAICPGARYVHIVRDGYEVASSIENVIRKSAFKILGKEKFNVWWGDDCNKWKMLMSEGGLHGYFPDEAPLLKDDLERGAYEWIVSIAEIDKYRDVLGVRLLEIRYTDLVEAPKHTLAMISDFLALGSDERWLNSAVQMIKSAREEKEKSIVLPPQMTEAFNAYQARYGFKTRAISTERSVEMRGAGAARQ